MGDLTEDFDRVEFACRCGCGFNGISLFLVNRMQVIRDIVRLPVLINSGWRCEKHNKDVGGVTRSPHLVGLAADFTLGPLEEPTLERLCLNLLSDWSGGFHYYPPKLTGGLRRPSFCHVDIGGRRRW